MDRVSVKSGKPQIFVSENRYLPGLSYIPDTIEINESSFIQAKVAAEFLDFLECVTDLMQLLTSLKSKHLRTMKPIPNDVIREFKQGAKVRNRTRAIIFEKNLAELSVGITSSTERIIHKSHDTHQLSGSASVAVSVVTTNSVGGQASKNWRGPGKPMLKNKTSGTKFQTAAQALKDIVGRKGQKPQWHVVAAHPYETTATRLADEKKRLRQKLQRGGGNSATNSFTSSSKQAGFKDKDVGKKLLNLPPIKRLPKVPSGFSIVFATSRLAYNKEPSDAQKEVMTAFAEGFADVETHRAYMDTLEPHWYRELVFKCIRMGIQQTDEMRSGFKRLSKFFEINCQTITLAKAKLCLLVHSLPIWEMTRVQMQRAFEFVMAEVLLLPDHVMELKQWLAARGLPYVVTPPRSDAGGVPGAEKNADKRRSIPHVSGKTSSIKNMEESQMKMLISPKGE